MQRAVSGQFLFFDLVSVLSGFPVTGLSGAISGRKATDGISGMIVLSGNIIELGGGMYRANLYDFDTSGLQIGYLFTASGCVPRSFHVDTVDLSSGRNYPASGVNAVVPPSSISGVVANSGLFTTVLPANLSGVFGTASLNSGESVNVYSGQLSGQQVNLLSGNQIAVVSGTQVNTFSGRTFPASGQIAFPVWNEVLTGSTYNTLTTAGWRLRTLQDTGNYQYGAVWLDTNGTNSGTTFPGDGTYLNPVNTWAHTLSVAGQATQPLKQVFALAGTTITLQSGLFGWNLQGNSYNFAPGGFGLASTVITHAYTSGVVAASTSGSPVVFDTCPLATVTLPPCVLIDCGLQTSMTLNGSGGYTLVNCFSEAQGAASPFIDFVSGNRTISMKIRNWQGGLTLRNIISGDVVTVDGCGSLTIDPTCVGGFLSVRGTWQLTNSGNLTTFNQSARFGSGNVYPASGFTATMSGMNYLASGQFVNVYSGQLSGQQVAATATVGSGSVYLASGHFLFGSGQYFLASGQSVSLNSGQNVNVNSGQLSGQPVTPISGTTFIAPNQVTIPASGTAYLASGSVFPTTFSSGTIDRYVPESLLKFNYSGITGEAERSLLNATRKLINKWDAGNTLSGFLTVFKENDSTAAYTQAIGSTSGAAPITSLDT